MGGDTNFKIPHYSQYTIKGIRELEWVQSELAARGLKDPWIRNEVWRYKNFTTPRQALFKMGLRGFPIAAVLMAATVAVDNAFGITAARKEEQHAILMSYPGDHHVAHEH